MVISFLRHFILIVTVVCPSAVFAFQGLTSHSSDWGTVQIKAPVCFGGGSAVIDASDNSSNSIFLGGSFERAGPCEGQGFVFSKASAAKQSGFPTISGTVYTVVPDGANGWYIGGDFQQVGTFARNRLAQIDSTGAVTAWNPNANAVVINMIKIGSILYVGGTFTTIGGSTRNRVAAIHTDGTLQAFDPNANNMVTSLATDSGNIYIGGAFTSIGGTAVARLAKSDSAGVIDTTWQPAPNSTVRGLQILSGNIYFVGQFTSVVGPTARNYAAATSLSSPATATAWNPNLNSTGRTIETDGTQIWIGGFFTTAGGTARNYLASFNNTSGELNAWNPSPNNYVYKLHWDGTSLFVSGEFNTFLTAGATRLSIAKFDPTSTTPLAWNINATATARGMASDGLGNIFIGGFMTSFHAIDRRYFAVMDMNMNLMNYDANITGPVNVQVFSVRYNPATNRVYIGGRLTTVGGLARSNIAQLAPSGVTSWAPSVDQGVFDMYVDPSNEKLYAVGQFTVANSTARLRGANFLADGSLDTWNPNLNSYPVSIVRYGNTFMLAGSFTTINGVGRSYIGQVDMAGTVTSWTIAVSDYINCAKVFGDTIYIGGAFTSVGGQVRGQTAAVNIPTQTLTAFAPVMDAGAYDFKVQSDGDVIISGAVTTVNSVARGVARVNATGTTTRSWAPAPTTPPYYLLQIGNRLWGMSYDFIGNGVVRGGIAEFDLVTGEVK